MNMDNIETIITSNKKLNAVWLRKKSGINCGILKYIYLYSHLCINTLNELKIKGKAGILGFIIIKRLVYSAKKKKTNITAECSVINQLTNSDSASAKSKGALLVSAI